MPPRKPRVHPGDVFGRLTVIEGAGQGKRGKRMSRCQCECGNIHIASNNGLRTGRTRSCGCLREEGRRLLTRTHGESSRNRTVEYCAWAGMLGRCRNPRNAKWEHYGGRGIAVCERWQSYENFLADMGRKPSPQHSLDRIDVDGDYTPENCRWATATEQRCNQRRMAKEAEGGRRASG